VALVFFRFPSPQKFDARLCCACRETSWKMHVLFGWRVWSVGCRNAAKKIGNGVQRLN